MGVGSTRRLPRLWIQTCRSVTAGLALDELKLPCSHIRVTTENEHDGSDGALVNTTARVGEASGKVFPQET